MWLLIVGVPAFGCSDSRIQEAQDFPPFKQESDYLDFAMSRSGERVALAGRLGVGVWNIKSRKQVEFFSADYAECAALSPDGKLLAAGTDPGAGRIPTITIWDIDSRKQLAQFTEHEFGIPALTFSPDGESLAAADRSTRIVIWNLGTLKRGFVLPNTPGGFPKLCYAPDGTRLAIKSGPGSGHGGSAIKIWKLTSPQGLEQAFENTGVDYHAISFSRDGELFAAVGVYSRFPYEGRKVAFLWDTKTWDVRHSVVLEAGSSGDLRFLPDSSALVLGATLEGQTEMKAGLRFLDLKTWQTLALVPGAFDRFDFTPDGNEMVAWTGRSLKTFSVRELLSSGNKDEKALSWVSLRF